MHTGHLALFKLFHPCYNTGIVGKMQVLFSKANHHCGCLFTEYNILCKLEDTSILFFGVFEWPSGDSCPTSLGCFFPLVNRRYFHRKQDFPTKENAFCVAFKLLKPSANKPCTQGLSQLQGSFAIRIKMAQVGKV